MTSLAASGWLQNVIRSPSDAVFSTVVFFYNFRSEAYNDVISGVAVDYVGMDVRVKVGDSRSKGSR